MKKIFLPSVCVAALAGNLFASAGPGPWAAGAYYPGQLDGKYQAAVYGNNITGVVGFALKDGAPPFDERTGIAGAAAAGGAGGAGGGAGAAAGAAGTAAQAVNTDLGLDETQNYFAIFVQGRTYTGRTVGMVDIDRKTVTATMIGAQPAFTYQELTIAQAFGVIVTNVVVTPDPPGPAIVTTNTAFESIQTENVVPVLDNLPLVNRGLSGGFKAKLKNTQSLLTFKGTGQLSTPAQAQTVLGMPNTFDLPRPGTNTNPLVITGFTPATLTAQIQTHSVPFSVYGIKSSFLANDPLAATESTAAAGAGN
jgi:hypothetical protein